MTERNVHCDRDSVSFADLETPTWIHQHVPLLRAMQKLEVFALRARDNEERNCCAIATIICAHAASEAFLNEWAKSHARSIYEEIAGRHASLLLMAEAVLPKLGTGLSEDLIELVNVRNALCHPAPAPWGASVPADLYPCAHRAAAVARLLHSQCFPESAVASRATVTT